MTKKLKYNYINDYLFEILSKGRYSVTFRELSIKFDASDKALQQNIYRLKSKNQLAQVRKGFYVIVPPQYSNRGMVPPTLFIDDLMKFLKREYYVGLLSAAALHGAGHQQPMAFQVIIKKQPLRSIKNQKLNISFFTKRIWEKDQITEIKTETGYINVSLPELTAFDLVYHNKKIGGLNRIIPIIEELTEVMKVSQITRIAKSQMTPTIQRLGYLLNEMGNETLANPFQKIIDKRTTKEIPLSLAHKNRTGEVDEKWKVIVNTKLDI